MSGIFGLFDPGGPDVSLLERAALEAPHRGRPIVVADGPFACGAWRRDGDAEPVLRQGGVLLVADARIDGVVRRSRRAGHRSPRPAEALDTLLSQGGPDALSSVAADFALARFVTSERSITLARDAFGLRPLYWAGRGARFGFASEPEMLVALELARPDPDREAIIEMLFEGVARGERTSIDGIRRVRPGGWIRWHGGGVARGRWFHPEQTGPDEGLTLDRAAAEAKEALVSAVASRGRGRDVVVMLSGGPDSSCIAVALAEAGIRATCLTFVAQGVASEADAARALALSLGHRWRALPVRPTLDPHRLPRSLDFDPAATAVTSIDLAFRDAVAEIGADIVLSGEGGDLLFHASPIALLDLVRGGQARAALGAARSYHRHWRYPYPVLARICVRAGAPRRVVAARERMRRRAPWLIEPVGSALAHPRSDRTNLLRSLGDAQPDIASSLQRLLQEVGATVSWPLCDLRVVDVSLRMPTRLRIPHPEPKPVLAALLRGRGRALPTSRLPAYIRVASGAALQDLPDPLGAMSLAVTGGFVRSEGLTAVSDPRWARDAMNLIGLEIWLTRLR